MKRALLLMFLCYYAVSAPAQYRMHIENKLKDFCYIDYIGGTNRYWEATAFFHDSTQKKLEDLDNGFSFIPLTRFYYFKYKKYKQIVDYIRAYKQYDTGKYNFSNTFPFRVVLSENGKIDTLLIYSVHNDSKYVKYVDGILDIVKKNRYKKKDVEMMEYLLREQLKWTIDYREIP